MTKRISINILAISLIGILLVPITGSAHRVGGQNPPEEVHKVIEVLYRLDPENVHDEVKHNHNNYEAPRWFDPKPCDGYEGGHSGYDVAHEGDDDAPFYSLTDGRVIEVVHPKADKKKLSYLAVYNAADNKTVLYLHPSQIDVEIGDRVKVGTTRLGRQGDTGFSTNPHVHLEIRAGEWKIPSCGAHPILAKHRHHRNEDPIPFLYEHVKDFNGGADNGRATNRPDLVIESIEPKVITLEPEESFRISSTLKNQGTEASKETTLGYYRSTDDRISSNDRLIKGPFSRRALAPNGTIEKGTRITAPKIPGTYYYGTCVEAVDNESDTDNNCSEAVKVIVRGPDPNDADVNGDGVVDVEDLVQVAAAYGETGRSDEDVNGDGIVDIDDLILVADAIDDAADAPAIRPQVQALFTEAQLQKLLTEAKARRNISAKRGLAFLEQLFRLSISKKTTLLANYPNPFNPETWIPYRLAKPVEVRVRIYSVHGRLIRTLALGHQPAGIYQSRSRAAYWDGKNELGEKVASGVYFYTLKAGEFAATRKMLIRK